MTAYQMHRRISPLLVTAIVVVALAAGGGIGYLATRSGRTANSPGSNAAANSPGSNAAAITPGTSSSSSTSTPPPLTVAAVRPRPGTQRMNPAAPITITFSSPIAADSAKPRLSPSTPGTWKASGDTLSFTPSVAFLPLTPVTLVVPSGSSGVRSSDGGTLAKGVVARYRTENGSIARLQQLLSLLDYSPLSWQPAGPGIAPNDEAGQRRALVDPPRGSFTWRNQGWPSQLLALWQPGTYNTFTKGLVMSFQADHGQIPNGLVNQVLWISLLNALSAHTVNTGGYNYALANKTPPETLTVWHDGRVVVTSPANTGIASSPTADGTFPVFSRLRSQVMKGTNPDGSSYADLVQYIAYFNGNDAVHYMPRAGYGIPQSLGCVELPYAQAAQVWPYLAYGTLVTVIN